MERYERYEALFYAIARPKLFTAALFKQLIRLNAPLSRNVFQLLHVLRDPDSRMELLEDELQGKSWGRIAYTAYDAVMQHAAR